MDTLYCRHQLLKFKPCEDHGSWGTAERDDDDDQDDADKAKALEEELANAKAVIAAWSGAHVKTQESRNGSTTSTGPATTSNSTRRNWLTRTRRNVRSPRTRSL